MFLFFFQFAQASALNEVAFYRRCFVHLTGVTPPKDDIRLNLVRNSSLKGIDACNQLLDLAQIDPSSADGRLLNANDPLAKVILNHLYRVQTMFIKNRTMSQGSIPQFIEDLSSTEDVYDNTVVGLAYTEALLNPNRNFSDLFTLAKAPTAKREIDTTVTYPFYMRNLYGITAASTTEPVYGARTRHYEKYWGDSGKTVPVNPDNVPFSLTTNFSAPLTHTTQTWNRIEVGELVGIHYNAPVKTVNGGAATSLNGIPVGFDVSAPIVPGVMFLRPYVMANAALSITNNLRSTVEFMHRRLSQSIIRDFLCREVPVLRETDTSPFLSSSANALPFRKGSSCVGCHATMDQMAGTFRGFGYIQGGNRIDTSLNKFSAHAHLWAPSMSASAAEGGAGASWVIPAEKDVDFYKRPQSGRFLYRANGGALISKDLSGPADIGTTFRDLEDSYTCYANRMFEHFTGMKVTMFDVGDPSRADQLSAMSKQDWHYRNFIVYLGKVLKQNNHASDVVREILKSDIYRASDFQPGGQ
jgi:hypothetical protein